MVFNAPTKEELGKTQNSNIDQVGEMNTADSVLYFRERNPVGRVKIASTTWKGDETKVENVS